MCEQWIAVIDDPLYIGLLSNNKWIGYKVRQGPVDKKQD